MNSMITDSQQSWRQHLNAGSILHGYSHREAIAKLIAPLRGQPHKLGEQELRGMKKGIRNFQPARFLEAATSLTGMGIPTDDICRTIRHPKTQDLFGLTQQDKYGSPQAARIRYFELPELPYGQIPSNFACFQSRGLITFLKKANFDNINFPSRLCEDTEAHNECVTFAEAVIRRKNKPLGTFTEREEEIYHLLYNIFSHWQNRMKPDNRLQEAERDKYVLAVSPAYQWLARQSLNRPWKNCLEPHIGSEWQYFYDGLINSCEDNTLGVYLCYREDPFATAPLAFTTMVPYYDDNNEQIWLPDSSETALKCNSRTMDYCAASLAATLNGPIKKGTYALRRSPPYVNASDFLQDVVEL